MAKEVLSLQEKMVLIRARIPALVKRTYSEDVNYDFTKIDDIFRYLTPAMNEYKVNWEIESEKATITDGSGNPIFVRYLERPMLWLYEADLTICWINAEQPEDKVSVTLHAIGTHEMPEKAKGSALTYAFKYYLLDKFCINQGGEDPDMRTPVFPKGEHDRRDTPDGNTESNFTETASEDCGNHGEAVQTNTTADAQLDDGHEEHALETEPDAFSQIPPASEHIRPSNGRMVELPESARQEQGNEPVKTLEKESVTAPIRESATAQATAPEGGQSGTPSISYHEACDVVCTIGMLRGHRLGDLLAKEEGLENLNWIAHNYKGKNEQLREAARLLLEAGQAA